MRAFLGGSFVILTSLLFTLGCTPGPTPPVKDSKDKEARIKEALDQLSPADRKLAEEQKYCAVQTKNRLGSMDTPIRVMVNEQPVFLCCESCKKAALKDPDKTLETVKKLKADNAGTARK
jgi:hypothetical protein